MPINIVDIPMIKRTDTKITVKNRSNNSRENFNFYKRDDGVTACEVGKYLNRNFNVDDINFARKKYETLNILVQTGENNTCINESIIDYVISVGEKSIFADFSVSDSVSEFLCVLDEIKNIDEKIPKIMNYVINGTIEMTEYLSFKSFRKFNEKWIIRVYVKDYSLSGCLSKSKAMKHQIVLRQYNENNDFLKKINLLYFHGGYICDDGIIFCEKIPKNNGEIHISRHKDSVAIYGTKKNNVYIDQIYNSGESLEANLIDLQPSSDYAHDINYFKISFNKILQCD